MGGFFFIFKGAHTCGLKRFVCDLFYILKLANIEVHILVEKKYDHWITCTRKLSSRLYGGWCERIKEIWIHACTRTFPTLSQIIIRRLKQWPYNCAPNTHTYTPAFCESWSLYIYPVYNSPESPDFPKKNVCLNMSSPGEASGRIERSYMHA